MRPRVFILPLAALIIAGLCAYKLSRSDESGDANRPLVINRPAPLFELYNQRKPPQIVRLASFIGRHRIVLVFFESEKGIEENPVLNWLRQHADTLRSENVQVLAIGTALPQNHREMLENLLEDREQVPFLMLSDLDGKVHQLYGRVDEMQNVLPGVFLIDRAGNLPWNRKHPLPLDDPLSELPRALSME